MNASLPRELQTATRFEVTEKHLALLKRTHIDYDRWTEFGAPAVNPKRPYGNSLVYTDLAEILGVTPTEVDDDDEPELSDSQKHALLRLHHEMTVVIQILVVNLSIHVGHYSRSSPYHDLDWSPATD